MGRFRTIGRSQLSNPTDLPCYVFMSINDLAIKIDVIEVDGKHYFVSMESVTLLFNMDDGT